MASFSTDLNGLVGCKVPTDLVKISVKEATHMGFYYRTNSELCVNQVVKLRTNIGYQFW